MTRPLRIEYEGALYHITCRGDRKNDIVVDDVDRQLWLKILTEVVTKMDWLCHAYCLMDNHYHLVIETPKANLAKGMRQLNGIFTQATNRRHDCVGHLFQCRYKSILVDGDAYLLELCRYVVLNPVRAGMVDTASAWPWSSYRAMVGEQSVPSLLTTTMLLNHFSSQLPRACMRAPAYTTMLDLTPVGEGVGLMFA